MKNSKCGELQYYITEVGLLGESAVQVLCMYMYEYGKR
jgi:hypothetical protein